MSGSCTARRPVGVVLGPTATRTSSAKGNRRGKTLAAAIDVQRLTAHCIRWRAAERVFHQSGLMFAAFTTFAHFAISDF